MNVSKSAPTRRPRLKVSEVAQRLGVHRETIHAWIRTGVIGANGQLVKLHAEKIGGLKFVRRRDLRAFQAACRGEASPAAPVDRTLADRKRRAAKALAEFDRRTGR